MELQSDRARWEYIYKRGFRYLVVFDNPGFVLEFIPIPQMDQIPDWLDLSRQQFKDYSILELKGKDSSHEVEIVCRQEESREWNLVSPYFETR
jgi:hypothetical protein